MHEDIAAQRCNKDKSDKPSSLFGGENRLGGVQPLLHQKQRNIEAKKKKDEKRYDRYENRYDTNENIKKFSAIHDSLHCVHDQYTHNCLFTDEQAQTGS